LRVLRDKWKKIQKSSKLFRKLYKSKNSLKKNKHSPTHQLIQKLKRMERTRRELPHPKKKRKLKKNHQRKILHKKRHLKKKLQRNEPLLISRQPI